MLYKYIMYLYFQREECDQRGMWQEIRREAKKSWPLTPECFHSQQTVDIRKRRWQGEEAREAVKRGKETRTGDMGGKKERKEGKETRRWSKERKLGKGTKGEEEIV